MLALDLQLGDSLCSANAGPAPRMKVQRGPDTALWTEFRGAQEDD